MKIHIGNQFGVYFTESLKNTTEEFWQDVLSNYINAENYEQRILFFLKHDLNYQVEYKAVIPFHYDDWDFNGLLVSCEQELRRDGISEPSPSNEALIKWYVKQDLETSEIRTIDRRNFILFQNRFKLNVTPRSGSPNEEKILYNLCLEKLITKSYPGILADRMIELFSSKKVLDKKIQLREVINQIQEKIKRLKHLRDNPPPPLSEVETMKQTIKMKNSIAFGEEVYFQNDEEFLEGYEKCLMEGTDYVPHTTRITYDFIHGKNTAMFEILLPKMHEKKDIEEAETIENSELIMSDTAKLKWKGTPSQFGYILNELIENGYLERPHKQYTKSAKIYMQLFEIETTTKNLENEINVSKNSLVPKNKGKFKIPHIDKLD